MFDFLKKEAHPHHDLILLILRVILGVIFIAYGLQHVIGVQGFIEAFSNPDVGFETTFIIPTTLATITAWAELLGGIAVLLGVFTRIGAGLIAVVMAVAIAFVKLPMVIGQGDPALGLTGVLDKDLAYLAIAVVLIIANAGRYAVAQFLPKAHIVRQL